MIIKTKHTEYSCYRAVRSGNNVDIYSDESTIRMTLLDPEIISVVDGVLEISDDYVPSEKEDSAAMLIDHEYRLTLLELGLTEY